MGWRGFAIGRGYILFACTLAPELKSICKGLFMCSDKLRQVLDLSAVAYKIQP